MAYRDQTRAKIAFDRVDAASRETFKDKYGRLCLRLPSLIQYNGLCQALAFLESKGKPEHRRLLDDLAATTQKATNGAALTNLARTEPGAGYMRLTDEALRCSVFLKRYAEAVLKPDLTAPDLEETEPAA